MGILNHHVCFIPLSLIGMFPQSTICRRRAHISQVSKIYYVPLNLSFQIIRNISHMLSFQFSQFIELLLTAQLVMILKLYLVNLSINLVLKHFHFIFIERNSQSPFDLFNSSFYIIYNFDSHLFIIFQ